MASFQIPLSVCAKNNNSLNILNSLIKISDSNLVCKNSEIKNLLDLDRSLKIINYVFEILNEDSHSKIFILTLIPKVLCDLKLIDLHFCFIVYYFVFISTLNIVLFTGGSSGCFPSQTQVKLENGRKLAMSELQVGDQVETGRVI